MHDLIIVGAGLAGLTLARRMASAGADLLVLEARARIGGRVLNHITPHGTYDLGPAWIWPAMQPSIAAAITSAGLAIDPQDDRGGFLFQDRTGAVQRLPHGFEQDPPSMRIAGGIGALVRHTAHALPPGTIRLGHTITSLTATPGGVTLDCTTEAGPARFSAARVALAMPPRLIASLGFTPALPAATRQHLAGMPTWMAGHAKALALYDDAFWRRTGLSGAAISHVGPLAELHDASLPGVTDEAAIFGFFAWPAAMRANRRAQLQALVTAQLATLFGPAAATPRHIIIQDWAEETFTATQSDHTGPAQHPHYAPTPLPAPWHDIALPCGSESAPEFGGYLEGALVAAAAVADRLMPGASGRVQASTSFL
jgi:monoamine oxidase